MFASSVDWSKLSRPSHFPNAHSLVYNTQANRNPWLLEEPWPWLRFGLFSPRVNPGRVQGWFLTVRSRQTTHMEKEQGPGLNKMNSIAAFSKNYREGICPAPTTPHLGVWLLLRCWDTERLAALCSALHLVESQGRLIWTTCCAKGSCWTNLPNSRATNQLYQLCCFSTRSNDSLIQSPCKMWPHRCLSVRMWTQVWVGQGWDLGQRPAVVSYKRLVIWLIWILCPPECGKYSTPVPQIRENQ